MHLEGRTIGMTRFDPKAYATAWNTHDLDRLMAFYHDDIEVVDAVAGPRSSGRDRMREGIAAVFRAFPDVNCDVERAVVEGRRAALLLRVTGTNEGEYNGRPATGKRAEYPIATFVDLDDDGLIVRETNVWDPNAFLKMLEVEDSAREIERARG